MNRILLLFFAFLVCIHANAQSDTTSRKQWKFDMTGGAFYQQSLTPGTPEFKAPQYLELRRPVEPELANRWGLRNNKNVTDNPLGHGPMYIRPHVWYHPKPSLELYASLAVDHRGASWGPYNTDNIAWVPRFHGKYDDWKELKNGDSIRVFGKMGYFEDYRLNEGLMLYNIDVQGLMMGIQLGNFTFSTSRMGDLIRAYGLGIDGLTDYQFSWTGIPILISNKLDVRMGLHKMIGFPSTGGDQRIPTVSAAIYNNRFRLYAEAGYRRTDFSPARNMAAVVGISDKNRTRRFSMEWRFEYRYYGGGFNYQFRNEEATHFRDTGRPAGSNFIGEAVYPLSFLGRPFSQWAVFTEYDKPWVQGLTFFGKPVFELSKNTSVFADIDVNVIIASGEDPFCYPFYNSGFRFNVDARSFLSVSLTNRTMNLDKHYTTYYLVTSPIFQFEVKRTL
ncbi:MAG: hypothetical protein JSS79_11360 [Bacteroidetes bacterium]|nr:hypothetical protein [Bacteroidota bacterium]